MKRILIVITVLVSLANCALAAGDPIFKNYELHGLLACRISDLAASSRPEPANTEAAIKAEVSAAMLGEYPAGQIVPVVLTNADNNSMYVGGSAEQHARLVEWLKIADRKVEQYFVRIDNDIPVPVSEAGPLAFHENSEGPNRYKETVLKLTPISDGKVRLTGSYVVDSKAITHHPIDITLEVGQPVVVKDENGKEHTFLLGRYQK